MSFVLGLLLMGNLAQASEATCPYLVERQDGTQIQQIWSEATQSCFFSINPLDAYVDLVYRDYLLTSEGLFMVFNSYGPGNESETTGAREFYLFPRKSQSYSYKWNAGARELEVTHVTGDKFVFDSKKARLKSISNATVTVANEVVPSNGGGVEISKYQGLLLDGGFRVGAPPTANANGKSAFTDTNEKSCTVKNAEIFNYTSDGDILLKYDDKGLATFLKKRCPSLRFP